MSAILLPFTDARTIDWRGFEAHVCRTADAGLVSAVNMDTGYVHLLDRETKRDVLARTVAARQTAVRRRCIRRGPMPPRWPSTAVSP